MTKKTGQIVKKSSFFPKKFDFRLIHLRNDQKKWSFFSKKIKKSSKIDQKSPKIPQNRPPASRKIAVSGDKREKVEKIVFFF